MVAFPYISRERLRENESTYVQTRAILLFKFNSKNHHVKCDRFLVDLVFLIGLK